MTEQEDSKFICGIVVAGIDHKSSLKESDRLGSRVARAKERLQLGQAVQRGRGRPIASSRRRQLLLCVGVVGLQGRERRELFHVRAMQDRRAVRGDAASNIDVPVAWRAACTEILRLGKGEQPCLQGVGPIHRAGLGAALLRDGSQYLDEFGLAEYTAPRRPRSYAAMRCASATGVVAAALAADPNSSAKAAHRSPVPAVEFYSTVKMAHSRISFPLVCGLGECLPRQGQTGKNTVQNQTVVVLDVGDGLRVVGVER